MDFHDHCHAMKDGECSWRFCPQLADGEPAKTRRHCPLDTRDVETGECTDKCGSYAPPETEADQVSYQMLKERHAEANARNALFYHDRKKS